jgi:hypothetical protein
MEDVAMNFQIVVILGVVGTYVIGSALESYAWRSTVGWSAEARQRVMERVQRFERQLRILDILSFVLILLCVLRLAGLFRGYVSPIYAPRGLVVAVALLALERILRGWLTWRAFSTEEYVDATSTAMRSALVSTVIQIALAAWVGWWVFTKVSVAKRGTTGGATTTQTTGGSNGTETGEDDPQVSAKPLWMTEAEALQFCGKDKKYLDMLTVYESGVFPQALREMVNGRMMYRREQLEKIQAGGWPSVEEMQRARQQDPKPPQPLTEGDLLKD